MKKAKYIFVFFLLFSFLTKANAATLTDEEYNRLKIIFSDARISDIVEWINRIYGEPDFHYFRICVISW